MTMDSMAQFDGIHVSGPLSVMVMQGAECEVSVPPSLGQLHLSVVDGVLHLDHPTDEPGATSIIDVTLPRLRRVVNRGAGKVSLAPRDEQRTRLSLSNLGVGSISAQGAVNVLDAYLEGSGDLLLHQLHAVFARLINEGSGTIWARVSRSARMEASGSGGIRLNAHMATAAQARRLGWDGVLP